MVSKEDVLAGFGTDITNPKSEKDGSLLQADLLQRAGWFLRDGGREAVVDVLRDWIRERDWLTTHALLVAKAHGLHELVPDIEALRTDIVEERAFKPYYVCWADDALEQLRKAHE